jgi:multiple sugar transport system substrate-binding protein
LDSTVILRGITWGHSRGLVPMVATAQRYSELHSGVRVQWELRSLQAFADQSIEALARSYDLLVIDHPSIGEAAAHGLFLPLDAHLPPAFLEDQARHSVGQSHPSYTHTGHAWALATDAATPVSAARPDVLARHGERIPETWEELIALARRGLVAFAGLKLDCLMHWYTLCINEGAEPFTEPHRIVVPEVGVAALQAIKELVDACGPACRNRNPIAAYELLSAADDLGYSPFAYGYSNYARPSYAARPLKFGPLVSRKGRRLRSTLGGAGLAVSAHCKAIAAATDYARFVASGEVQTGLYTAMGGQPGHRRAWLDEENNRITNGYFRDTLSTLDEAYLRPRYAGYITFQEQAPDVIARFLSGQIDAPTAFAELDALDAAHRKGGLDERHLQQGGPQ